ncbi:MAG TPA: hypothetical protein VGG25_21120 [Streptosporangiaceae bacterium]|jgi:hypothetical protein
MRSWTFWFRLVLEGAKAVGKTATAQRRGRAGRCPDANDERRLFSRMAASANCVIESGDLAVGGRAVSALRWDAAAQRQHGNANVKDVSPGDAGIRRAHFTALPGRPRRAG